MKRTKRLLSTLLALCMVLAMLPATAMAAGNTEPAKKPVDRYTVLVLDQSGSMYGDPLEQMKAAALKFCDAVAEDNANTATTKTWNKVAVLGFSTQPNANVSFTDDVNQMRAAINQLAADSLTDIAAALLEADRLLKGVGASTNEYDVVKNIVLLSDGLPETNEPGTYNGRYSNSNHWGVPQANRCWDIVDSNGLLKEYNVYSLGFFHDMEFDDIAFCGRVLNDLQNAGFYAVQSAEDLDFVFEDFITEDIIGGDGETVAPPDTRDPDAHDRTVITIACPVDVTVSVADISVSSANQVVGTRLNIGNYGWMDISEGTNGTTKKITVVEEYRYAIGMKATGDGAVKVTVEHYAANSSAPSSTEIKEPITVKRGQNGTIRVRNNGSVYISPITDETQTVRDNRTHFSFVPTVTGGTVVLSKRNAEPGDWVNVYVTPDEGYKLESLTVTDMRGWPVTLREMGENAFSFTMPNARINVNPVFVKIEADDDPYSTNVPTNIPNIEGTSPNYGNMVINTAAMNYSDVNAGDWFYNNVKFCHERYLLNKTGEADGKFEPNTASTRATVWTALSRLAGRNTVTQGDNWYDRAQIWAKGKGITDGERPMDSMTREEFVTMLWRYDGNKYVQNSALGQFNDGESVSWWATEAVKWAVATGLLNGSNGSLNPQSNVTRAEVAAVLQRYVQNVH